jgi:hypothetical protein
MAVEIRRTDHTTPSIRKSWHFLRSRTQDMEFSFFFSCYAPRPVSVAPVRHDPSLGETQWSRDREQHWPRGCQIRDGVYHTGPVADNSCCFYSTWVETDIWLLDPMSERSSSPLYCHLFPLLHKLLLPFHRKMDAHAVLRVLLSDLPLFQFFWPCDIRRDAEEDRYG